MNCLTQFEVFEVIFQGLRSDGVVVAGCVVSCLPCWLFFLLASELARSRICWWTCWLSCWLVTLFARCPRFPFKTTDNYKCEDYIHQVTNTRHRIALTKLRLSNHKLAIETGRYSRPFKKPAERTCPICKVEMEDEYHFLNICPAYQEKRSSLLDYLENEYRIKISRKSPRIFMFLKNPPSGNGRIQKLIAKHILECFEKRKGEDRKVNTQGFLSPWVFS